MVETPLTGLVLSGGGARAAYQVGVLRAIARLRRERLGHRARLSNPFGVITGTSAGAINAAALACHADRFEGAVEVLGRVWENFSADQVYRADALGVLRTGARWLTMLSAGWLIARFRKLRPRSLLDNAPLGELLQQAVPLHRLPMLLQQRQLHALAVTASSYSTGEHVTFYSAAQPIEPWLRSQRIALPTEQIGIEHLLASSAIPFIFPAARVAGPGGHAGWYGDGSMRQSAPLSPAIHLGAERLLIIGAGRMHEPPAQAPRHPDADYPSLAQIAGHAMSSIFLDALTVDIERMQRINRTLALLPDSVRQDTPLRPLESLVISPSQRIDDIATRHLDNLPTPVRALLRGVGVGGVGPDARGAALASYLLFEAPFTKELMALGEADTLARADEVYQFFAWPVQRPSRPPEPATPAAAWAQVTAPLPVISAPPDIELP
ncbi:patatin-like phospholipase family protein [Aquabacterium sp. OR-4]|uniref:patatin-like phospholipase family protein n=1 Tax=Aquabacterium sp. OR-4 TaxID=2978127 RepID=UPI0021B3BA4C|nr:patatin-like phospholipase family protein [Aquabacterium sp. OR-4]MDT7834137.1 patatin-like phospholipase family protein [Aquabacterium sp. OR-4]